MATRKITLISLLFWCVTIPAYADYMVRNHGTWPQTWPRELEQLRKQAHTLVGPVADYLHYAIPFNKRADFESAWPQLLKVKTPGAPIFLIRGENFFLGAGHKAGVVVHTPPANSTQPVEPIPQHTNPRLRWGNTNYLELQVDGEIVDLNRIPLPDDGPIIDERFKEAKQK